MDVKYTLLAAAIIVITPGLASAADPPAAPTAPSSTPTATSTATSTPTPTATATSTSTPTATATATSTPTATVDPGAPLEKPLTFAERRHTMAVLEGGIIALPNAPISASQRGGSVPFTTVGHGDATLQTGVRLLFRGGKDWVIGTGALFGPSPTSDSQYGGTNQIPRTHSRNYMVFTAEGRYVPIRAGAFEGWVGIVAGGVIIADRFTTDAGDTLPSIVGTKEVTVRTEGFVLGAQAGVTWNFTERWGAGFVLRGNQWILPTSALCTPIGDCATLTGSVQSFDAGLSIGYRIPL